MCVYMHVYIYITCAACLCGRVRSCIAQKAGKGSRGSIRFGLSERVLYKEFKTKSFSSSPFNLHSCIVTNACICICIFECMFVSMYVGTYTFGYACICVYMFGGVYIYIHICMHACTQMCVYIYIHAFSYTIYTHDRNICAISWSRRKRLERINQIWALRVNTQQRVQDQRFFVIALPSTCTRVK